jgi:hypothetical protein
MSFYADLKFGEDSERLLLEAHPFLEYMDGRKSDLRIKGTNILIEKKADSYDMNKYGNIIIERYSKEKKDGGPFSALKNGCRYFVYMFVQNRKIFVFDTVQLIARVKKLAKQGKIKLANKENVSWTTQYYKVKITDLEDLDLGMQKLERLHEQAKARKAKRDNKNKK